MGILLSLLWLLIYYSFHHLQNTKMDLEISEDKVKRLEREVAELSDSSVTQEGKDSMQLKRMRVELESKLQEQEEELDEQAGTIQQLEQVGSCSLSDIIFVDVHQVKVFLW